jgi:hypothetical protein
VSSCFLSKRKRGRRECVAALRATQPLGRRGKRTAARRISAACAAQVLSSGSLRLATNTKKEGCLGDGEVDGMAKQAQCVAWRRWCGGKLW